MTAKKSGQTAKLPQPAVPSAPPARRERLFLLDGMALAYRAFFSFISRPLINSRGENTSAIYGFVNTLMKLLADDRPEHIAVVFDTKEPTFRHVMYDQYKATREKMPEEMAGQIDKLKEVVRAFNVPSIELPGYEADDIMGTLARRAERQGIETWLVTGDKDFMQLVSPLVRIYRPGKRGDEWELLDARAVHEKFGVDPAHVVDVLGLIGDKSDNVPGVHGVGEKSAIPLVVQYGTIEEIIRRLDEVKPPGLQEKIRKNVETALLSKKLVTIDTEVPLDVDLHHLTAKPKDSALLLRLFGELEFKGLLRKIAEGGGSSSPAAPYAAAPYAAAPDAPQESPPERPAPSSLGGIPHTYHVVRTEAELKRLVAVLMKSPFVVFDTETTSTDALQAALVGLSFAVEPGEAWYVPVAEGSPGKTIGEISRKTTRKISGKLSTGGLFDERRAPRHPSHAASLPCESVLKALTPLFASKKVRKAGQNVKYDMLVLAAHGVEMEGTPFDSMVANYVLRPDGQHGMDALAVEHLNYQPISYDDLTGAGRDRKELREIDVERIAEYAAEDADVTLRLCRLLEEKLRGDELLGLCEEIEFPLIPVLAAMERAGVALDAEYLADLSKEMERMLTGLTGEISRHAGETFNLNSTQQLSKILFEKLKLAVVRKTKTGFSTDVGVLETLRHEHPIIELLLEYRQLQKLKSTYVDALPALINPKTGRVHTSYNQTVAATGRLSSSNPNLQNIPIRTEIGRSIRKAFLPGARGSVMLSADYSQIELRIMAHMSGDEALRDAFANGEDIHATTAAKVFGVPLAGVSKDMRRKAKEVNFGIMYGIGPFGLSTRLDIPQQEAKAIIATYFERFPGVNRYMQETLAQARQTGCVTTLSGRRRFIPDIASKNFAVRGNAERQAINMPIQGTAADMIKKAMIAIQRRIEEEKIDAVMLLQVHDELVFEVKKGAVEKTSALVAEEMKNALPLSVPIGVDVGSGKTWLDAH